MTRFPLLAALPAIVAGWPAAADITGAELWDIWQAGEESGATVTAAEETREGRILRLEGVSARFDIQGSSATAMIDWAELEDRNDGTVRVTSAQDYDLRLEDPATPDRPATVFDGTLRHEGAVTTVAREGGVFSTETEAPEMVVLFEDIASDDASGTLDVTLTLTDLASSTRRDPGAPGDGETEMQAASLALDLAGEEEGQTFRITGRYDDVYSRTSGPLLAYLGEGGAISAATGTAPLSGETGHGGSLVRIDATSADGDVTMETSSEQGSLSVTAAEGRASYEGTTRGMTLAVDGDTIPVSDASLSIERVDFTAELPVIPSQEPEAFDARYEIAGLTVSEEVWALVDPGGALPRDPAELSLEISGTGRMTAAAGDEMGVEVATLRLDGLLLSALGAELTGVGMLDLAAGATPFEPVGELTFGLTGANTLIDRMAEAGILPPGQIVGTRMALGMFTAPADGADALRSTVTFGPGGTIEVNGTRMR